MCRLRQFLNRYIRTNIMCEEHNLLVFQYLNETQDNNHVKIDSFH